MPEYKMTFSRILDFFMGRVLPEFLPCTLMRTFPVVSIKLIDFGGL